MELAAPQRYIVILDDDPMIHKIIEKATGYPVMGFNSPDMLLAGIENLNPMAAFVDIFLDNDKNGLECIPTLRKAWPFIPILVITGSSPQEMITKSLACGADDFVQKPIIPEEVGARLKLRLADSAQKAAQKIIHFGDITIDAGHRCVSGPKGKRYVSPTEIAILSYLAQSAGALIQKNDLKQMCWGADVVTDNAFHRKLHVVRNLLKVISETVVIQSKYGVGFYLKSINNNMKIAS